MTEQAIFLAFAQTHSNGTVIKASSSLWTQTTLKEKRDWGLQLCFVSPTSECFSVIKKMLSDSFFLECPGTAGGIISSRIIFLSCTGTTSP